MDWAFCIPSPLMLILTHIAYQTLLSYSMPNWDQQLAHNNGIISILTLVFFFFFGLI